MGRPAASLHNKRFALGVASLVTIATDDSKDTVARCGTCSIFALVNRVCPAIIRGNDGPRDGLTEMELNKALQV